MRQSAPQAPHHTHKPRARRRRNKHTSKTNRSRIPYQTQRTVAAAGSTYMASADTCAQPLSCPARPLPRPLESDSTCCASLPRPAHCPRRLPSLHTALQLRLACARNCCQEETSGCHHCCRDLEHAHGTASAGLPGTRAGYKARARATEDARPTLASEMQSACRPQCRPSRCRGSSCHREPATAR
jgi:hypothetical protein